MTAETGFHEVPWDVFSANGGNDEGLPPTPGRHGEPCCTSKWVGFIPSEEPCPTWVCSWPLGHVGTHRGGDSVSIVAEWRDQDAEGGAR